MKNGFLFAIFGAFVLALSACTEPPEGGAAPDQPAAPAPMD